MILDTNFLIWLGNEEPESDQSTPATDLARQFRDEGTVTRVPSIVIWELYKSVGLGNKPVLSQQGFRPLLSSLPVIDLSDNIARRAGVLYGTQKSSDTSKNLNMPDSIIAATSLAMNEPVVTDDSDFDDVEGLERVSWLGA